MGPALTSCLSPPNVSKPQEGKSAPAASPPAGSAPNAPASPSTVAKTGSTPPIGAAVQTPYGVGVLSAIRSDGMAVVVLDFFAKAYLELSQVTLLAAIPAAGSRVTTVYGDGVLTMVRKTDNCAVVKFDFGATGFLRVDQIRPIRAKPFVPASYWTSGAFAGTPIEAKTAPSEAPKRTQDQAEVPTPAADEEEKEDTAGAASKKKKKKGGKN